MTREFAISETKELWREIKATGLTKDDFLRTGKGREWLNKNYFADCPLCEYTKDSCNMCPLVQKYGEQCNKLGYKSNGESNEFFTAIENL